jgi:2-C-methyl-D-erythritol 4-phosphate cytidylyltransferase
MKVTVIIPAAGVGTRMAPGTAGKKPSKQFAELHGAPILIHTLRKFVACERVTEIIVALRKTEADAFAPRLKQEGFQRPVRLVEGGDNRQQSVANAMAEVKGEDGDLVLVHDAVRPLVDPQTILAVMDAAAKYGAAIAGLPAVDTVKQVDRTAEGAIVATTIPRERVVLAQTPQGFRLGVLRQAFAAAQADGFNGTDEASLVERAGRDVAVVMGSPENIKITTPGDLELAEFFLAREARRRAAGD